MNFKQWINENIIPLPSVLQSHNYDCGATALRSIATFFKVGPENHDEFIKVCNTKKRGTNIEDIIRAAKLFGLKTKAIENMPLEQLKLFIKSGKPVIICMQAGKDTKNKHKDYNQLKSGHYVVVMGFDEKNIHIEDPLMKGSRGILPYKEFLARWHDKDDRREYHQFGIAIWKDMKETPETQHIEKKKKVK